jgi:plastocyanin
MARPGSGTSGVLALIAGIILILGVGTVVYLGFATAKLPADAAGISAAPGTIVIHDLQFDPAEVTVTKGASITWVNKDEIPVQVQSDSFGTTPTVPGQFSSEPLNPGESFTQSFNDAGTFTYSDPFHPYMTGSVVVK